MLLTSGADAAVLGSVLIAAGDGPRLPLRRCQINSFLWCRLPLSGGEQDVHAFCTCHLREVSPWCMAERSTAACLAQQQQTRLCADQHGC